MAVFPADTSSVVLLRAPWVVPVVSQVIRDGALAVTGECILDVGSWAELSQKFPQSAVHHSTGVILPGLINCHIHLELSVFGTIPLPDPDSSMCDWVRSLLQKRMAAEFSEDEISETAERFAKEQLLSGVVALLDTGNSVLPAFKEKVPEIYSLFELLGPTIQATDIALQTLDELNADICPTGHAPYSTSPRLLQQIKQQTVSQNSIFSLHVEENPDESRLLFQGTGCFKEFLEERNAFDGTFPLEKGKYHSVVDYLQKTGILDARTICVHCVNIQENDIQLLKQSKCHICLCPGSNQFLGVGKAPIDAMLQQNILPALGTDSIASNTQLNMWHEMALIREDYPGVNSETIVAMATMAGAKALGLERKYGSLEKGKSSNCIAVEDEKISTAESEKELLDILTSLDNPENIVRFREKIAA